MEELLSSDDERPSTGAQVVGAKHDGFVRSRYKDQQVLFICFIDGLLILFLFFE